MITRLILNLVSKISKIKITKKWIVDNLMEISVLFWVFFGSVSIFFLKKLGASIDILLEIRYLCIVSVVLLWMYTFIKKT